MTENPKPTANSEPLLLSPWTMEVFNIEGRYHGSLYRRKTKERDEVGVYDSFDDAYRAVLKALDAKLASNLI